MDFLKQVKKPSTKKRDVLNLSVEIKKGFTENNNEKLILFLNMLKKNISLRNFKYLSYPTKTDKTVFLTQIDPHEIKQIKSKQKMVISSDIRDGKLAKREPGVSTKQKGVGVVPKKNIQNADDLTNNNHDGMFDFVSKYQKYADDDSIFKVPLADSFVLNNKTSFVSEIRDKLTKYLNLSDKAVSEESSCDDSSTSTGFDPLIHQELVKQYLNSYSPYRGVVLYHGLGSGKTCTSIGVIEAMKTTKRKIFILTPASLKKNYISQMKFCGSNYFQEDGDWEYVEFPTDDTRGKFITNIHKMTKLSISRYLNKRNGVYLQRKTPKSGNDFVKIDKKVLSEQINEMIKGRFQFISYNGITMDAWKNKYKGENSNYNPFDNSVVIIDEGHNFVSRIVNKLNVNGDSVSVQMYQHILTADNCNVVMLTGTPLINYPNELGVLFNLVSGCNPLVQMRCVHDNRKMVHIKKFKKALESLGNIDYITYLESTNTLKVMKNPYGFVNEASGKIKYDTNQNISVHEFKDKVIELLQQAGYRILGLADSKNNMIQMQKKFPDTKDAFDNIFIDRQNNGLKNKKYFQTKIAGLVSYVGDKKELMPTIVPSGKDEDIFIELVEMNENVMKHYDIARAIERILDSNAKKSSKSADKDAQSGSYKIFSRAACNFVFPSKIDRFSSFGEAKNDVSKIEGQLNRPILNIDKIENLGEDQLELLTHQEMITMNDGKYDSKDIGDLGTKVNKKRRGEFAEKVAFLLNELTNNAYKYFDSDLEKLVKTRIMKTEMDPDYEINDENELKLYSPKFHKLLGNILNNENYGLHLMYSNFRTLEGIGIFKIILEYYGYSEFKIVKSSNELGTNEYKMEIGNAFYYNSSFESNNNNNNESPDDEFTTLAGRKFYALYTGKEGEEEKEIIRNIYNGKFENIPANIKRDIRKYFFNNNAAGMTNMYGEVINLLMISSSGAEGIDLKNVRYVHITEPYWHPVRVDQVIGRAKRICSHKDLPEELQNVTVFMYLLSYNKKLLKDKESLYTQLINGDTDEDGNVITTDEKLLKIMKKKKKLMRQFLTAMKEASVDCIFNHEEKEKCLSFPLPKSGINPHKTQQTNLHYKDDAYENIKAPTREVTTNVDDRGKYTDKKKTSSVLKTKYVKVDGKGGMKKKVGVDFTKSPPVAFDLKDKSRLGLLEKEKNDGYLLTLDKEK